MARRKHREGEELQRVLGVPALFSTAYGNVGSSIYYALGVVAASAMGATPIVFVLTGMLFVTIAWSYAEATAALPEAGGSASFARRAFNEFVSFGIGWGQMLVYTATIAISALFVPQYLSVFWPILNHWPYNAIGGIVTAVALVAINVFGIKEAARINILLALLDLATQIIIMAIALVSAARADDPSRTDQVGCRAHLDAVPLRPRHRHRGLHGHRDGVQHGRGSHESGAGRAAGHQHGHRRGHHRLHRHAPRRLVGHAGALEHRGDGPRPARLHRPGEGRAGRAGRHVRARRRSEETVVYVPVEAIGDEMFIPAQQPPDERTGQVVDGTPVANLYGTQLGSNYSGDPVLGLVRFLPESLGWVKDVLAIWVGILAATILVIATNAGLIGVSRLTYSFGQHNQLPPVLGRMHARRMTPYVSIILFGAIACVLIIPGRVTPPCGLVRLRLDDLVHGGAHLGDRAAHQGAGPGASLAHPVQHPRTRPTSARHGADRRRGDVLRLDRDRLVPELQPDHRLLLDHRSGSSRTSCTAGPRATRLLSRSTACTCPSRCSRTSTTTRSSCRSSAPGSAIT